MQPHRHCRGTSVPACCNSRRFRPPLPASPLLLLLLAVGVLLMLLPVPVPVLPPLSSCSASTRLTLRPAALNTRHVVLLPVTLSSTEEVALKVAVEGVRRGTAVPSAATSARKALYSGSERLSW